MKRLAYIIAAVFAMAAPVMAGYLTVSGTLNPDARGEYTETGTYGGQPAYHGGNIGYWIWFYEPAGVWYLSFDKEDQTGWLGDLQSANPVGIYAPLDPATGIATVTNSPNSNVVLFTTSDAYTWQGSGNDLVWTSSGGSDGHWTDPYSTNSVGYAFLLDGQSGTNVNPLYGSIGSAADNSAVAGVPNHNVVSNYPAVSNGPVWTVLGTNSLGDEIRGWNFDRVDDRMIVSDKNVLTFVDGIADSPFTFSVWMRTTLGANGYQVFAQKLKEYSFVMQNAGPYMKLYDRGSAGSDYLYFISPALGTVSAISNKWFHLTWVYDGTSNTNSVKYYVNSVPTALSSKVVVNSYVAMTNTTTVLDIGWQSAAIMKGDLVFMDFVRTNLSPIEVTNKFQNNGGWNVALSNDWSDAIRAKLPLDAYP